MNKAEIAARAAHAKAWAELLKEEALAARERSEEADAAAKAWAAKAMAQKEIKNKSPTWRQALGDDPL